MIRAGGLAPWSHNRPLDPKGRGGAWNGQSAAFWLGRLTYQLSRKSRPQDELVVHRFITQQFSESDQTRADLAAAFERLGERDQAIESCRSLEFLK